MNKVTSFLKSYKKIALFIFLFALVLRLVVLGIVYPGADKVKYWENVDIAENLVRGNGYSISLSWRNYTYSKEVFIDKNIQIKQMKGSRPTALKPPGYTLIVAAIFFMFGIKSFFILFVLQSIMSALTCVCMYLTLVKSSKITALLTGTGIALYPPFVIHSVAYPENTTMVLFLISFLMLYLTKMEADESYKSWLIAGIIGGILVLTEIIAIPFITLALLYAMFYSAGKTKANVKKAIAAFALIFAIISPWLIRNYVVFEKVGLLKGGTGQSLMHGLSDSGSDIRLDDQKLLELERQGRSKSEVQEDDAIMKALSPLIFQHLTLYIEKTVLKNFISLWWETEKYHGNKSIKYLLGRKIPYTLLLLLSIPAFLYSIIMLFGNPRYIHPLKIPFNISLILMFTFTVPYMIFGAMSLRYQFPIQLVLFIFMAETLLYLKNLSINAFKNIIEH